MSNTGAARKFLANREIDFDKMIVYLLNNKGDRLTASKILRVHSTRWVFPSAIGPIDAGAPFLNAVEPLYQEYMFNKEVEKTLCE